MSGPPLGDAEWQALYARLEHPLYNLAYRYVWQREDALDVVHDAFLKLWTRRASIRMETADRYLWVMTLNGARNHRRWRRLRGWLDATDEPVESRPSQEPGPDSAWYATARSAALHRAIDALPEKLREVLLLAEFSDWNHAQIATILRIPPGTVASRRHLALKQLRARLENES